VVALKRCCAAKRCASFAAIGGPPSKVPITSLKRSLAVCSKYVRMIALIICCEFWVWERNLYNRFFLLLFFITEFICTFRNYHNFLTFWNLINSLIFFLVFIDFYFLLKFWFK
jgi:hypothetical protein